MIFPCPHCDEPVVPGSRHSHLGPMPTEEFDGDCFQPGLNDPQITCIHSECLIRMVVGSLGHQMGLCGCGGRRTVLDDPPGMSTRGAARLAYAYWRAKQLENRTEEQTEKRDVIH